MDPELAEIKEMVEANHRILKKLLAHQRYSTMISVLKWSLIIGTALGTYYYLQPYIEQGFKAYDSLSPVFNPGEGFVKAISGQK